MPQAHRSHEEVKWLRLLWQRRGLLARAAGLGLVLSTILALVWPKRYESTIRLMPPDAPSGGMAMMAALAGKDSGGMGALAGDLLGAKSSGALFLDILASRTVEDRLIERFDLREVYFDRYWQDARKDLAKNTSLSENRKSGVITIAASDRDPRRAAQMAQAYVEELDRLVAQVSTSSARRERMFIEQRLAAVKQDLDQASREFSEYASQNTAIDLSTQGKAMVDAAAHLQGELIVAQSELESLTQIYTENNVRVRSLRARVDELRRELDKLGGDGSKLGTIHAEGPPQFPSIRNLPLLGVRWSELYSRFKMQETIYGLLTQQYELAKIQEAKEIPTVKVLDTANLPEKKSFPPRSIMALAGTALALAGAMSWIFAGRLWQETDALDPRKLLVQEIVASLKAARPRAAKEKFGLAPAPEAEKV